MIFNIQCLAEELQIALQEFTQFKFASDGCLICAEQGENYIDYNGDKLTITYSSKARFIYSLFVFDTLGKTGSTACAFENFSCMVDMSRNAVRKVETVKDFMRNLVLMGYTGLQIYMEDVYEIPSEPYFGHKRGRYSQKELKEIVSYGKTIGVKCVPAIHTLAHLNGITRWRKFALTVIDTDDILLVDEPKTYELIEKMFASLRECFDCEEINIGMDEANNLGLGKYLSQHGYVDRMSILIRHLHKVYSLANKYGFTKPMMWGDMFIRLANNGEYGASENFKLPDSVLNLVPENLTLISWFYYRLKEKDYHNSFSLLRKFNRPVAYASGAVSWLGITPINQFSIKQNTVAVRACKKAKIKDYMITIWGDDGAECSLYATLPTLAYTASLAYNEKGYKRLFERLTGIRFNQYLRVDSPNEIAKIEKYFLVAQPSRYMLYNDCLQGIYDSTITQGDGEKFKDVELRLHKLTKKNQFGYIFKAQETLAKLLYYKYELTSKTRIAYQQNDRETLQKIVDVDYKKILKYLDEFYEDFRYQWYKENKPQGFEVQDYRLGGLKQRVMNGRRILQEYLDGKTENVAELEEPVLSVLCDESRDGCAMDARTFVEVVTANVFGHQVR